MIKLKEILENDVNIFGKTLMELSKKDVMKRPVCGGVVKNDEGKYLIVHSDFANQGWFFPKGGMDEGETTIEAAKREVQEESGVISINSILAPSIVVKSKFVFENTLGFDSPRTHNEGNSISQGAYDALKKVSDLIGQSNEWFIENRYNLFDKFSNIMVKWKSEPIIYHFFTHKGNDVGKSNETDDVKWLTIDEIKKISHLHGHTRQIISSSSFKEFMA